MGALSQLSQFLTQNVGQRAVTGSTAGGLNARLGSLLPYVVGTTGTVLAYPSTNAVTASANNGTFGTSNFTTVVSSGTLSAHMLVGILAFSTALLADGLTHWFQVDIASGAAGAEVIQFKTHVAGSSLSAASNGVNARAVMPPLQWPTNERISQRVSGDTTAVPIGVTAIFAQRPL